MTSEGAAGVPRAGGVPDGAPGVWAGLSLVFVGGSVGTLARHALVLATPGPAGIAVLTIATINVAGSYLLGFLIGRLRAIAAPRARRLRLLLGTGALGGFTTYSTLASQVVDISFDGAWRLAALLPALSVLLGVGAAVIGLRHGSHSAGRAS